MKRVLLAILGVVAVAVLILLGLAASKPSTFRVARDIAINAPPSTVYTHIEDLHHFGDWSPWEKLDPNMKRTFTGAEHGTGAVYEWLGNSDVGEGRMTIIDTRPNEQVTIRLEFIKPFEATNTTVWDIKPTGSGSQVTWSMSGPNSFMGKLFSVFADVDSMVGKDFELGLANLKRVSESGAAGAPTPAPAAAAAK